MRFRLRTLLVLIAIAALFLTLAVPFVRWWQTRPGMDVGSSGGDAEQIRRQLGNESIQDLHLWHLYGMNNNFLWQAKATPDAVEMLKRMMHLRPVDEKHVPPEFWSMPPEISEVPAWWRPKPIAGAEYYISPAFVPQHVANSSLDGVVMYDPSEQRVFVWSQFGF